MRRRKAAIVLTSAMVLSGLVVASPAASIAATGGLVAAYGFEESSGQSVLDAGDFGLTGTISGNAARTAAGKFGGALSFDGIDDRVDVPDAEQLQTPSSFI